MANSKTVVKTYFIRFDGFSFHIDRIFPTKDLEKIFSELFTEEKGWTELQELFEHEFSDDKASQILGCPIPKNADDSYDYLAAFVKYYVGKGHLQFFSDVDKTWADPDESFGPAYSFVNDLDKMLTIMKNCISGDRDENESMLIESEHTEHLKMNKYVSKKRKTKS